MSTTHTIFICSNSEIVGNSFAGLDNEHASEEITREFVDAAKKVILASSLDVDYEIDSHFSNWQGGKHYVLGAKIGGQVYGYGCGNVCTHEIDPSEELKKLVDAASDAGIAAAKKHAELCEAEDQD